MTEDNWVWRDCGDLTYEELSGAKVEYEIYDGATWHRGFGELVVYQNPQGLMHVEVHDFPNSAVPYPTFEPRIAASFSLSRHANPDLAAFHLKSNG